LRSLLSFITPLPLWSSKDSALEGQPTNFPQDPVDRRADPLSARQLWKAHPPPSREACGQGMRSAAKKPQLLF
jgi:hypothetical protein